MLESKPSIPLLLPAVLLLAAGSSCGLPRSAAKMTPAGAVRPSPSRPRIVFFGDSLTAGYGVGRDQAFPSLVQKELDGAGLAFECVNAGVSGDTTQDGVSRLDWVLSAGAALFVLELGANDGLRGLDLTAARSNLAKILDQVAERRLPAVLIGMRVPPNYGKVYAANFQEMFEALARERSLPFVPFLLEGVGGHPELTQPDGLHPNAAGQKVMAQTVWKTLEPIVRGLSATSRAGSSRP